MQPRPMAEDPEYRPAGKLRGKVALITGGDSGIGRAVAILYAKEGADISIVYLNEHEDAQATKARVEELGRRCLTIAGDVGDEGFCKRAVRTTADHFGRIDVLVNNAAEQHLREDLLELGSDQLERTFRTNILSMFYLTKACLPHMGEGSAIVNTTSVTAYAGNPALIDYSATKGAIVSFTRSLSQNLAPRGYSRQCSRARADMDAVDTGHISSREG